MLTCVQIVSSLAPSWGGLSYAVPALAEAVAAQGATVQVRSVEGVPAAHHAGVAHSLHARSSNVWGRLTWASPSLRSALEMDARHGAILHTNGLWLMPNIYPARIKKHLGPHVGVVHSPHGMLGSAALKISAWKKKPVWWLLQRRALGAADCLHATAESEYEEIRAVGLHNPVAIVPNGIDLPDLDSSLQRSTLHRTVISLGRIHPKKGLDRLIQAWARLESDFPCWRLRIIGPAEVNYDQELIALTRHLGAQRISIEGPLYGEEKLATYRTTDLFVLPTRNENFAISVAEALAAEVPVISSKGAPWSGLETERCGWWIDHGVEPLVATLRKAMTLPPEQRHEMGTRGRNWMARDFSWDRIARDMLEVYAWVKHGGDAPVTVRRS